MANSDDMENFAKEFILTACMSVLKTVVHEVSTTNSDYFFRDGKVEYNYFLNATYSKIYKIKKWSKNDTAQIKLPERHYKSQKLPFF